MFSAPDLGFRVERPLLKTTENLSLVVSADLNRKEPAQGSRRIAPGEGNEGELSAGVGECANTLGGDEEMRTMVAMAGMPAAAHWRDLMIANLSQWRGI